MALDKKKKKARTVRKRKIRFRKIVLKMTDVQKRKIDRYCQFHGTTMNRLIKVALSEYIELHGGEVAEDEPVSKNQLKLFNPDDYKHSGKQMNLFESQGS